MVQYDSELFNYHHCLIPEHFHHPPEEASYISSPVPLPWQPRICVLSQLACLFQTVHIHEMI